MAVQQLPIWDMISKVCLSLSAKASHNVAIEMHNNFIKNVVSIERTALKAISVAKLIFRVVTVHFDSL